MEPSTPPHLTIIEQLRSLTTATLGEVLGGTGIIDAPLHPLTTPCQLCGPALPITIPSNDNLSVHLALEHATPGTILVVHCDGGPTHGFWGEIATVAAMAKGVAGLLTDGAVRDTDAIRRLGFPVFCAAVHIRGTIKARRGSVGQAIVMGGATIHPGDYVVADSDGIVVVRPADAPAAVLAAKARDEKEQRIIEALWAGKTTVDLLGLAKLGIERRT